jgi:hypothetical protein
MAVQTTYSERQRRGIAGSRSNMVPFTVVTRIIESAGGVGYPVAVSQGTNENGCIVGGTAAGFVGITLRDNTIINSASPDVYPRYTNVNILTRGEIFITAPTGGVTPADPVTFDSSTGVVGKTAADGTHLAIAGARWKASYAAGDLACLELGIQRS